MTGSRLAPFVIASALVGCSSKPVPTVVAVEPELAVVRERMLALEDRDHRPLFGPDGAVTVGTTRFTVAGKRAPRSHGAINGQIHPIAVAGTAAHPQVLSIAWSDFPHPSGGEVQGDGAWLVVGDPDAGATFVPTGIPFSNESIYEQAPAIELSPDRSAIVAVEHASVDDVLLAGAEANPESQDAFVVRSIPAGKVLARATRGEGSNRACWIDAHRIAWRETPTALAILDVTTRTKTRVVAPAGELVACSAGGGAAAIATPSTLAIVDLPTGRTRSVIALDDPRGAPAMKPAHRSPDAAALKDAPVDASDDDDERNERPQPDRFALGSAGCDVAMIRAHTFTLFHCESILGVTWYRTTLVRELAVDARPPTRLEFAPDARRLVLVGDNLVMLDTTGASHAPPSLPAMADLPTGFSRVAKSLGPYDAWSYAQLGSPTGLASLPAQIIHAQRDTDDPANVVTIAMELDALSTPPPPSDSTDAAIRTYAFAVMPELVEQWRNAEVGTDRDAEFTLKVGRRDGKPFFETREAWRDGCEPYDGYTQVVIDRDLLFVTRALVVPAASTNPWLQSFFDVPFQRRTQLARRRGPETGPC